MSRFVLESIRLREIRLALREPFRSSAGDVTDRRILLLELRDSDGTVAWSECVAGELPTYSPETIETAWLAIRDWLAPRLLGVEVESPAEVGAILGRNVRGHRMAIAALEMGCWGLEAERQGGSLAQLLGGTRERIATGIAIGLQESPTELVEKAQAALAAGYRRIKIKIEPAADVDYLEAVRAALGPAAPIMADANSAYTLDDADHLARLDRLDLMMIEQPLAWDDLVQHAELQRRLETPICLDESITDPAKARDSIALGSGRIMNVKPGRVGGFAAAREIHDLCAGAGIPVWCGGMLESGIGRAYNVALASLENFTLPGDVSPSARYWERDVVSPEWTMNGDGMVEVPQTRGLGVAVDGERIEALTVRTERLCR